MHIDTAMAARFLTALTGDAAHTFQTFCESGRGDRALSRTLHGTFARHAVTLQSLNLKGAAVCVMVNRGDGYGRTTANVVGARALFLDLDGAPVEPVLASPLPPRIVVESSPGKWHCYWPVTDLPLDRFTDAQKALALRFDGDPKVSDRARVMRLPGFLHNKSAPFQTRLVQCSGDPLTWHEMVQAFGLRDRFRLPHTIPEGERNNTLFKLAASAARKGVPQAEQARKAQTVNAATCDPPLPPEEVAQIVASAYSRPAQGVAAIPLAVLDSEPYKAMDNAARALLVLAYRKADSFGPFSLAHTELREWFPGKDTFHAIRKRLVGSGLLIVEREPKPPAPTIGRGPRPTLYRLAIGPFGGAYSTAEIGPFYRAPEALQAIAVKAPPAPAPADGRPDANRRAA